MELRNKGKEESWERIRKSIFFLCPEILREFHKIWDECRVAGELWIFFFLNRSSSNNGQFNPVWLVIEDKFLGLRSEKCNYFLFTRSISLSAPPGPPVLLPSLLSQRVHVWVGPRPRSRVWEGRCFSWEGDWLLLLQLRHWPQVRGPLRLHGPRQGHAANEAVWRLLRQAGPAPGDGLWVRQEDLYRRDRHQPLHGWPRLYDWGRQLRHHVLLWGE